MRWFTACLALVVALTQGVGCVSAIDRVSNGDRQLAYQNKSAAEKILDQATALQATLQSLGVPAPAAAIAAVDYIHQAALDIRVNSSQQIKNWGGEEAIQGKSEYSPEASAAARKAADDEHARMTKWALIWSGVSVAVGWGLKTIGASKIPLLGPVLAFLNKGQVQEHQLVQTLQAGADEARRKYDELAAAVRSRLSGTALEKLGDMIPTGDVLKERLEAELARKGLLELNTKLYEKNPLIPDTPATPPPVVVHVAAAPAPATG